MDEITKNWYFYNWVEDRTEQGKKMKDFGCFVGAFYNPKMAKAIQEDQKNTYNVSDDEFDIATDFVSKEIANNKDKKHRRKKIIKRK